MVSFVSFKPGVLSEIVTFWNEVFSHKRNAYPVTKGLYRRRIVERQAFDEEGLILALAEGDVVGLVHAVKPVPSDLPIYETRRCQDNGSIAVLIIAPEWRRKGVGTALLARAEAYLGRHLHAGRTIYVGDYDVPLYHTLEGPRQPFWGDTEIMGIARDNRTLIEFLAQRGYSAVNREGQEVTMEASLSQRERPDRPPLEELGLREVTVSDEKPWPGRIGWYRREDLRGYVHGRFGPYRHQVIALVRDDVLTSHVEWYPMHQEGRVGLFDFQVAENDRAQGLGSYLLDKSLWAMAGQGYRTVELHTNTKKNALAYGMYLRRDFDVVESWVALMKKV